ncbi:hypothetical protein FSARC_9232 [Fusarium sarcochroum]|uniref:SGNH hydrolase-type esterase domain-containing protein n=1 Tax=Fusarium sarcochroum TaxID=1208366 RepID=A0A8H4X6E1_9HYPO|nr:hypothetical protein FSARC_9232 [Fusarium sarcochroum]
MTRKTLRILCFGDSLTSGYFCHGMDSHPYALKLEDRLTGTFPEVDFEIVVDGVPGDVASFNRFYDRLDAAWKKQSYDWTIVLGGTNDLAYGVPTDNIFAALIDIYDVALSRESKVLALTVPECASKAEESTRARNELNERILNNADTGYYSFDLHSKIPYHSLSEEDRGRYWDDGLHLRDEGYNWMGNHIADALIDILWREGTFEQPTSSKTADPSDVIVEDEFTYDEEDGNPRNIHEGYVVVRKKDLD